MTASGPRHALEPGREPAGPGAKRCTRCGEVKPMGEFRRDRSRREGLGSRCTLCNRAVAKAWYAARYGAENAREEAGRG